MIAIEEIHGKARTTMLTLHTGNGCWETWIWPDVNAKHTKDPDLLNPRLPKLTTGKSPGPDNIRNELLKHLPEGLHQAIHKRFVLMWMTGNIPKSLERVLLYKKGNKNELSMWAKNGVGKHSTQAMDRYNCKLHSANMPTTMTLWAVHRKAPGKERLLQDSYRIWWTSCQMQNPAIHISTLCVRTSAQHQHNRPWPATVDHAENTRASTQMQHKS